MPPKGLQAVTEEVRYLWQPLRLVLLNFQCLTAIFERCQNEHRLKDFSSEAVPIIINALNLLMGEFWTNPRIPTRLAEAHQGLVQDWASNGFQATSMSGFWEKGHWRTKSLTC